MARWSSIPRFLAFATLAGGMLAAVVAAGIAVVAPRTGAAVPDRRWPGPPPSVVFGPDGAPTAGNVTVGLLVPAAPPRRLLDLVPPDVLAAFEAAEAAREGDPDTPDASEVGPAAYDLPFDSDDASERARALAARTAVLADVSSLLRSETGVDFTFVDVLACDAHAVPLVLVDGPVRFAGDAAALRSAIRLGTRVVRTAADGEDVGDVDPAALLERTHASQSDTLFLRCLDLLRTSPALVRLAQDPLEVLEAHRDGDDVIVRFRSVPAAAALHDLDDRVVATAAVARDGTVRVRCPDPALDPFRHRLVVTAATRVRLRAAPTVADLVGTAERRLLSGSVAEVGATFAPRVLSVNSKTSEPVPGTPVRLALRQGDRVLDERTFTTDAAGTADGALRVPDDAAEGPAELRLDDEPFPITIRSGLRISVVVDRPLYRPDDEVHVRLMVHRAASGAPVAARAVVVKLGAAEKTVTTSAYGIAATSFRLSGVEPGPLVVVARAGGVTAEAKLAVRAFEVPTFSVDVVPAELTLRPGERAPVVVTARYVNGAPVVGAKVAFERAYRGLESSVEATTTDASGRATAELLAEGHTRTLREAAEIRVTDADGRVVRRAVAVTVPRRAPGAPPTVSIHALDEAIVGRPCRVELRSPTPRRVTLTVTGRTLAHVPDSAAGTVAHDVEIPASGVAVVTILPTTSIVDLCVPQDGVHRWIDALEPFSVRPLVRRPAGVLTVGDPLSVEVFGGDGVVFVELVRGGVSLLATHVTVVGGRATLSVPLTPALAGMLDVRAWRLDGDTPVGSTVGVLVVRGRSLSVDARPAADSWRPAESATVEVSVRDRAGRPTAAVLGYWGVDRALLSLAPWAPGHEEVFDVVPVGSPIADVARAAELGRPASRDEVRLLLGEMRSPDLARELPLRFRDAPKRQEAADRAAAELAVAAATRARAAWVEACRAVPLARARTASSLQELLRGLVLEGRLDARDLVDPWGTPFVFGRPAVAERWSWSWSPSDASSAPWRSAGPGLRLAPGTAFSGSWTAATPLELGGRLGRLLRFLALRAADRGRPRILGEEVFVGGCDAAEFLGPIANNTLIGIGGSAGGAFRGRGGHRNLRAGGGGRLFPPEPVMVRKDFSPTLCFVPEAIVGPEGRATLSIPLKDALTTWDLRLVASSSDGAVGTATTSLRVTQPLHADPWIAPHLTVGDEVDLPVALRNETDAAVAIMARLILSRELSVVGDAVAAADVGPGGTGAVTFRVRAVAPGRARVLVDVAGGTEHDAIERVVVVRPETRTEVETVTATVSASAPLPAVLPVRAEAVRTERRVSLYPSALADIVAGFQGLLAHPHGCFEQTSATVYPMVLATAYLRRTHEVLPDFDRRARSYIAQGYEKLVTYEVPGEPGGFELWGRAPADAFLTAHALLEFHAIAAVHPVDEALVARIRAWLVAHQQPDGSWSPDEASALPPADRARRTFVRTAYVAWAFARVGAPSALANAFLEAHAAEATDPYAVALAALALLTSDRASPAGHALVDRLVALRSGDDHGVLWAPTGDTNIGARGESARIEATALAILALLADGRHAGLASHALDRLLAWRQRDGRFGTTQSTVLAMEALLASPAPLPAHGEVTIDDGHGGVRKVEVDGREFEPVHVDLGDGGVAPVGVTVRGGASVRATVSRTSWVPWDRSRERRGRLALEVAWPAEVLTVGPRYDATVTVSNPTAKTASAVTLEIGIPPGCDVEPDEVRGDGFERAERAETAVVLYLRDLPGGESRTFRIGFRPRYAIDVVTAPSKAYEYYVPEEAAEVGPRRVRARR